MANCSRLPSFQLSTCSSILYYPHPDERFAGMYNVHVRYSCTLYVLVFFFSAKRHGGFKISKIMALNGGCSWGSRTFVGPEGVVERSSVLLC